ncbi:protein of unknown function [Legionella longbeachae NSW150]|uniref:Uncharacterized protein n=1 Tax=Legionella longbeachae serogroup 1 (strain NSW150) TaxID=661367 RepID=D3HJU8_LEGLN|nr:protein of unknown function [Legionella longbeachae NSW150]
MIISVRCKENKKKIEIYNQFIPKRPVPNEGYFIASVHVHPNTITDRIIDSMRAELDFFIATPIRLIDDT